MEKEEINTLFNSFNTLKVLVIGDVMVDAYMWGDVERISPEAPVPVITINKRENRLGGAANVAMNLLAMGATPIICSVIGNDEKGKLFIELLKNKNLTTEGIIKSKNRHTTVKTRVIGSKNAENYRGFSSGHQPESKKRPGAMAACRSCSEEL